jgi:hypothetical protein
VDDGRSWHDGRLRRMAAARNRRIAELVQCSTRDSLTQGPNMQKFLWGKLFS